MFNISWETLGRIWGPNLPPKFHMNLGFSLNILSFQPSDSFLSYSLGHKMNFKQSMKIHTPKCGHASGWVKGISPDPMEKVNWSAYSPSYPALQKFPVKIKETEAVLTFCALLLQLETPWESNNLSYL